MSGLDNVKARVTFTHPVSALASYALGGYALVSAVFIGLGFLLIHIAGLRHWDEDVNRWYAADRTRPTNGWTSLLTRLADTSGIVVPLTVAIAIFLIVRWRWDAVFLAIALALELSAFLTINLLVDRPRPNVDRLGALPSTSSFPSGHTAATIALYGGIALVVGKRTHVIGRVLWAFAFALTAVVGFARVYRGFHHPSDVVAGALLGLCALAVALSVVRAGETATRTRRRPLVSDVDHPPHEELLR